MIRSVRFSLTIWHIGILAVILSIFGALLYTNVKINLFHTIDALSAAQADGVEDAIYSFWKAESENLPQGAPSRQFRDEAETGHLSTLILRWADETDELDTLRPIRILSADGKPLTFSPILTKWVIPVSNDDLREAGKGKKAFTTYLLADNKRVRVLTYSVMDFDRVFYFIQVATSLHQVDMSLDRLRVWLWELIPTTLFLTSLIGWFLASLILRPIGKMTRQVYELSESRLHERLDVPKTGDELQHLAVTFNEMLDRFEKGFKRLRQFSAAASHELRTPLTVLKGEMELTLSKPRSEEEYEKVLKNQLSVVNDMTHVVEQLLAVAHAEDGETAVNWEVLKLNEIARSISLAYEKMAASKKIAIRLAAPFPVLVKGEKSLLERLLSNLLENAIKHTPAEGQVVIEVTQREDHAQLTVTDTGKGIAPGEMTKIFDKFFDRNIPAAGVRSTGIGLGLCRWIVELHKGTIEIDNAPGAGAQFKVFLPAAV